MVFPAYAGMIPRCGLVVILCACVPRVCGDDPDTGLNIDLNL